MESTPKFQPGDIVEISGHSQIPDGERATVLNIDHHWLRIAFDNPKWDRPNRENNGINKRSFSIIGTSQTRETSVLSEYYAAVTGE